MKITNLKLQIPNKSQIPKFQKFGICFLVLGILLPTSVMAWTPGTPLVPCGGGSSGGVCVDEACIGGPSYGQFCATDVDCGAARACTKCDLLVLLKNLIDFVMIALGPILATVFFIVAGIYIMLGGVNPGMLATGKRIFNSTFIGIVIIMLAWLITNTLIQTLVRSGLVGASGNWWNLKCSDIGLI
jgi:hypothetical protein